nr:copper-translocating P-type ATPase [Campylobacter sp.]
MSKITLNITGMSCVNCANAITNGVLKIQGVKSAVINLAQNAGIFELDDLELIPQIKAKIKKLGYGVVDNHEELEILQKNQTKDIFQKMLLGFGLSIFIMIGEMLLEPNLALNLVLLGLSGIVIFYCGIYFYKHAIISLKNKNYDMSVLVFLGTLSAFLYSMAVIIAPNLLPKNMQYLYFSSSAMIISFVLLGKFLEANSKQKASDYLKTLLDLSPKTAWRINKDGTSEEIPANKLNINDIVEIKSGYNIPSDCVIISGGGEIDTAALSGESLPEFKGVGDKIFAGTTNTNGYITAKVLKTANNTLLAQILDLLSESGSKKIPVARLADRVANIFVPSVVGIALLTSLIWAFFDPLKGLIAGICVLIISCPCALGLATPIAIISGLSVGAKNGILIKNPQILELIKNIKFVVFDKTGTLTKGEISVIRSNLNNDDLQTIAQIEKLSSHPISKAITRFANCQKSDFEVSKFKNEAGLGVIYDDGKVLAGNLQLMNKFGVQIDKVDLFDTPNGVIFVAIDKIYKGFIEFSDTLRDNAKEIITTLKNQNITPVMLTGDKTSTALDIAQKIGITSVISEVLPNQKLDEIEKLKKQGKVIFVGDGINDALSLKAADIGIAMSSGSDIAKESGDIILIKNDLKSVLNVIKLGKSVMKTIKENLIWAFAYNAIFIPVAAGVLYPFFGLLLTPMYGAAAMSMSSVSVVLNSLRLKLIKFDITKD